LPRVCCSYALRPQHDRHRAVFRSSSSANIYSCQHPGSERCSRRCQFNQTRRQTTAYLAACNYQQVVRHDCQKREFVSRESPQRGTKHEPKQDDHVASSVTRSAGTPHDSGGAPRSIQCFACPSGQARAILSTIELKKVLEAMQRAHLPVQPVAEASLQFMAQKDYVNGLASIAKVQDRNSAVKYCTASGAGLTNPFLGNKHHSLLFKLMTAMKQSTRPVASN
jgi:hypothetical protein